MQTASLTGYVALIVLAQGTFVRGPVDLCLQIGIRHRIVVRFDNTQPREALDCELKVTSGFHEVEVDEIRTRRYQEFLQKRVSNDLGCGAALNQNVAAFCRCGGAD